jgi:hypothetical protein
MLPLLDQRSFEEISTLFWCVATLNTPYPPLLDRLSEIAIIKCQESSFDDLAKTLWALAKLGIKEPNYMRLAHSIADTFVSQKEKISKALPQTLAKTPKSFLDLGITPFLDLLILIIEESRLRIAEFSPKLLQIQLSSFDKMEIPRSQITSLHSVISKKLLVEESYKTFTLSEIQFWTYVFSNSPQKSPETQKFLEILVELVINQMKEINAASLEMLFHKISIEQIPQFLKEKLFAALAERLNTRVVIQDLSPEEILQWAAMFSAHKIACSQTKKLLEAFAFALCTPEKWPLLLADPAKVESFIYQLTDLGLRGPGSAKLLTSLAKTWYPLVTNSTPPPKLLNEIIAVFYSLAKLEIHFADEIPLIQQLAIELTKQVDSLPMGPFANFTWSLGKNHLDPHLLDINRLASTSYRNLPNLTSAQLAKVISGFRRLDIHSNELLLLFFDKIMKDFESFTLQELAEIANYIAVKTWSSPEQRTRATRNIRDLGVPLLHRILVKLKPLIEQLPSRDLAHIVRSVSECDLIENASEFNHTFLRIMEDILHRIPKALTQRAFNHEDYSIVLMGYVLIKQNKIFFRIPENSLSTIMAPLISKSSLETTSKNHHTFTTPELCETISGLMFFGIKEILLLDELAKELSERKLEALRPDVRELNIQGLGKILEFATRSRPEYIRQPFFIKLMEIYNRQAPKLS